MSVRRWMLFSLLFLATAMLLAIVVTPKLREGIRQQLIGSGREILATAEGNVLNDGGNAKIIKYRTEEGIFVEILKIDANGGTTLVDRLLLPDRHDGLFNFQGHVTRLAIADVDGDGSFELLAPSFDNQLVPHLNVFRYNAGIGRFEPVKASP
ncbi:MAG TPA: hypothetical protein PKC28_08725 [Bdellovibrionales bacterium]|nr:hypothetical protein [Bdellovibrionales bacterium]